MSKDEGDAEVEAEWRRIEEQRLAEERAEATEDAADPVPPPTKSRWPWLVLVAALAAGIAATIAINRPRPAGEPVGVPPPAGGARP